MRRIYKIEENQFDNNGSAVDAFNCNDDGNFDKNGAPEQPYGKGLDVSFLEGSRLTLAELPHWR